MKEIPKEESKIFRIVSNSKVEYISLTIKRKLPINRF